jgi:hypothetical protein
MCGLHTARGDLVFINDCDLEVSPALLESFADTMTKSGADVVYGYQESRRGGIASKYWAMRSGGSSTCYRRRQSLTTSVPSV